MAAQYELLSQLLKSGGRLDMGQELFYKFYQAFVLKDRWLQYIGGVGTTLLVTAIALAMGVLLGSVVALVRVAHDQQRPGRSNPVLGVFNAVCQVYTTVIRGTPMMVQLLIMSMVIFNNSRNFTMVGALALGINSGAYVSEIIRGGLMAVDPGQMEAGRSLGLNYITTMVVIIIPQAIRAVLPALGNEFIMLLKDTSLITVIGGKELLYAAQGIMNRTYEAMFPLFGVALIYLVLVMIFTWLLAKFESTIPAENMLAKPSTAEALPAILPYLAIAIEKEAEPNRDTVHTVKNRMAVTGISGHSKSIAIKNSKEPIVSCQRANVSNCRTVITLLNLALMALAKIIPQLLIPKR